MFEFAVCTYASVQVCSVVLEVLRSVVACDGASWTSATPKRPNVDN